jgi:phage protein D
MTLQRLPLQAETRPALSVAGQLRPHLTRDLVRLEARHDLDGLARLEMTLTAVGPAEGQAHEPLLWLDGEVLDFGRELEVTMGAEAGRATVFAGRISAIELDMSQGRAPEVTVRAEDRLMDLRMTHRCQTWLQLTDAELVQQIAARHGLQAQAEIDGPRHACLQQWNQSDLAFLRERARRLGAELWLDGRTLHMAAREQRQQPLVTLIQGHNLVHVQLRADLAHQRSSVHVAGWDDAQAEALDEAANDSAVRAEAQGGTHGPAVLQQAFGERHSLRTREVPLKGDEARAWARAQLLTRARRFVRASGVAEGDAGLQVGSRLCLQRVSPLFEGEGYVVTQVAHRFDLVHGYRTHFEAERAWVGQGA